MATNRNEEQHFFDRFSQLWIDFPVGNIQKREAPDFIIETPNSTWGVEITQVLNEKEDGEKYPPVQIQSLEDEIVKRAESNFLKRNNINLHVDFYFNNNLSISNNEIDRLAESICLAVETEMIGRHFEQPFSFRKEYPLPKEVLSLHGFFYPNITQSVWYSGKGRFLPHLEKRLLKAIIEKKEKRIGEYQKKAGKIILLMIEGIGSVSWFDNVELFENGELTSDFEKIFLIRNLSNQLIEIK